MRISIVTSTRADYGLLYGLVKLFSTNPDIELDFIATGTHLSKLHGYTIDKLIQDGFKPIPIDLEIRGDRPEDILRTMSTAMVKFSNYFTNFHPDLFIVLGDRYEIFAAAQAALLHNVSVAHIHGGEITEGALDDTFRHSLTKISKLHFTTTEEHRNRVIQMGESPKRVFNFGAPGLDNIINLKLLSSELLEKELKTKFNQKNILITYHPVTTSEAQTKEETEALFEALNSLPSHVSLYITMPNADAFSNGIRSRIYDFKQRNDGRTFIYENLGQLLYLSLMRQVDVVLGNSSSGLIEAPFMGKAVVNIGHRQLGRTSSQHVINVGGDKQSIVDGIELALSENFQEQIKTFKSYYGDGKTTEKIYHEIMRMNLDELLVAKKFHDLGRSQNV